MVPGKFAGAVIVVSADGKKNKEESPSSVRALAPSPNASTTYWDFGLPVTRYRATGRETTKASKSSQLCEMLFSRFENHARR